MKNFYYYRPRAMEELWEVVDKVDGAQVFLSGGTDLFPEIKLGRRAVDHVIDLKGIAELEFVSWEEGDHLRIGANTTLSKLLEKGMLPPSLSILKEAIWSIGSQQIRNRATLIGNICRASPASDSVPPLICLGSRVKVEDGHDAKYMDVEAFLKGPGQTQLGRGEIVTEVLIAKPSRKFGGSFIKLGRVAKDLAIVNVAVLVELDSDGITCSDARIVLGAVGPTAIRVKRGEELLVGQKIHDMPFEAVGELAMESCQAISDLRATAAYRKRMVQVLTRRAISKAIEDLKR